MRILIQLTGERIDIQDIQFGLNTSSWKIIEETDGFYLNSPELDKLNDNAEIISKAKQFLDVANGAANIFHQDHKHVGIGAIKQKNDKGGYNISISLSSTIQFRSRLRGTLTTNLDPSSNLIVTTIEDWIEKADKYESVRDTLHFFNEITWWNLYKIYEIINDDVGGQERLYKLIPKSELRLVTQAAQSRELLGEHARHASKKYKPPATPVTINQAHATIKKLFENWINLKE